MTRNRIQGRRRDGNPELDPNTPAPAASPSESSRLALRVSEAAEELCISPAYAYTLIHEGRLPHIRLGRRILILRAHLEEWVEEESQHQASHEDDLVG